MEVNFWQMTSFYTNKAFKYNVPRAPSDPINNEKVVLFGFKENYYSKNFEFSSFFKTSLWCFETSFSSSKLTKN